MIFQNIIKKFKKLEVIMILYKYIQEIDKRHKNRPILSKEERELKELLRVRQRIRKG